MVVVGGISGNHLIQLPCLQESQLEEITQENDNVQSGFRYLQDLAHLLDHKKRKKKRKKKKKEKEEK